MAKLKVCKKCGSLIERIEFGYGKAFFEHPEQEYFRPCSHPTYVGYEVITESEKGGDVYVVVKTQDGGEKA